MKRSWGCNHYPSLSYRHPHARYGPLQTGSVSILRKEWGLEENLEENRSLWWSRRAESLVIGEGGSSDKKDRISDRLAEKKGS